MAHLFHRLSAALLLRRLSRDLGAVAAALQQQNALLARLADRFAPVDPPATSRADVAASTGVDHLDADELALAEAHKARVYAQTGHLPDDEELLVYLADEKTQDLHTRLTERAEELRRLEEGRQW